MEREKTINILNGSVCAVNQGT